MKEVLFYFWVFVLTSYIGFIVETLWCIIKNKKIESRKGVIYEPMIPIYGASGMLIMIFVNILKIYAWYEIFLLGFIISTIVEFIASFLQEKIFATKSWDYSTFPLNFHGRVNLVYSLMFGCITLILYNAVLSPFAIFFSNINVNIILIIISIVMFIFMLYDFFISFLSVYRMKERKRNIERNSKFWKYIDHKYNDELLKKIFPNMVETK